MAPTSKLPRLLLAVLCAFFLMQGTHGLQCYTCDTTSAQSYADANDQCNIHNMDECADKRATACMLEGYMKPNNVAQVVKRCVLKCPVFINTTAEVVRCCPTNGCNGELNHRPPPHPDLNPMMRGRGFPPFGPREDEMGPPGGPPNMNSMDRPMRDGDGDMGPPPPGMLGPDGPPMPPMDSDRPPPPLVPGDDIDPNANPERGPSADRPPMKRGKNGRDAKDGGKNMKSDTPETRRKAVNSKSGMSDGQMADNFAVNVVPSFLYLLISFIIARLG